MSSAWFRAGRQRGTPFAPHGPEGPVTRPQQWGLITQRLIHASRSRSPASTQDSLFRLPDGPKEGQGRTTQYAR